MKKTQKKARLLAAFGAAALLTGASVAAAGEGMQAAVDAHGTLRQPTAAEVQKLLAPLQAMLNRSAESVQITERPDGTLSANLGTSYLNVWLAAVNPNGSLTQACVDNVDAAAAALQSSGLEVK
jgi:hypothetical protein